MAPRRKTLLIITAISALFIAALVAVSPQFLILTQKPIKSDAVIVLLGPVMEERMQTARELVAEGWSQYLIVPTTLKVFHLNKNEDLVPVEMSNSAPVEKERPTKNRSRYQYVEDTHIELVRARAILQDMGLKSVNFVSSPFHMRRIKIIAGRVFKGWNYPMAFVPASSDHRATARWWANPKDRWWVTSEYAKIAWFLIYAPFV